VGLGVIGVGDGVVQSPSPYRAAMRSGESAGKTGELMVAYFPW